MGRIEALTRALNSLKKVGIRTRTDVEDGDGFGKWHHGPADKSIGDSRATVYASLAGRDRLSEVWRQKAPHHDEYQRFLAAQQQQEQECDNCDGSADDTDIRARKGRPSTVTSYTIDLHEARQCAAPTRNPTASPDSAACASGNSSFSDPGAPEPLLGPHQDHPAFGLQELPPNPSPLGGANYRARSSADRADNPHSSVGGRSSSSDSFGSNIVAATTAVGSSTIAATTAVGSSTIAATTAVGSSTIAATTAVGSSTIAATTAVALSSPPHPPASFRRQASTFSPADMTGIGNNAAAAVRLPALRSAPQSLPLPYGSLQASPQSSFGAGAGPTPTGRSARILNPAGVQGATTSERAIVALTHHATPVGFRSAADGTSVRQFHPQPPPGSGPGSQTHPPPLAPPSQPQQHPPLLGPSALGPFLDERDARSPASSPLSASSSPADRPGGSVGIPRRRVGSVVGSGLAPSAPPASAPAPLSQPTQQLYPSSQQPQPPQQPACAVWAGQVSHDVLPGSVRQQPNPHPQLRPLSGGTIAFTNGSSGSSGSVWGGAVGGGGGCSREGASRPDSRRETALTLDEAVSLDIVEDTGRWFDAGDLSYCNPECEEEMAQILSDLVRSGRRSNAPSRSGSFTRGGSLGRVPSATLNHSRSLFASPPQGLASTGALAIASTTASPFGAAAVLVTAPGNGGLVGSGDAAQGPTDTTALPAIGSGGGVGAAAAACTAMMSVRRVGSSGRRSTGIVVGGTAAAVTGGAGGSDAFARVSDSLLPRLNWPPPAHGSLPCSPTISSAASPTGSSPRSPATSTRGTAPRSSSTTCNVHLVDLDSRTVDGEEAGPGSPAAAAAAVGNGAAAALGGSGGIRHCIHAHRRSSQLLIQAAGRRASTGLPPGMMAAVTPSGFLVPYTSPSTPGSPRAVRGLRGSSSGAVAEVPGR